MDNNLIELVYVLDRSGSMKDRVGDVIGGFNGLMDKQRKAPGRANVTILGFDSNYHGTGVFEILANGTDINVVSALNENTYFARGGTPLFDAIARAIDIVGKRLASTPEHQRPGKVLVTVMTDGEENQSIEYGRLAGGAARLREKIKHQQEKYSWDVVFMGANMDAVLAGGEMGLPMAKAITYAHTSGGVGGAFAVMNNYALRSRAMPSGAEALVSNSFSSLERAATVSDDPGTILGIGGMPPVAGGGQTVISSTTDSSKQP